MLDLYVSEIILKKDIEKGNYVKEIPAIKYLIEHKSIKLKNKVTFFVGENAMGKSTLIEAIAVAFGFNPEGGTKNFNFSTANAHSTLFKHLTLVKSKLPKDGFFLRAESYFNVASYINELDESPAFSPAIINSYGGVSLHNQSHGESFMALVKNRFSGNGLYILDEPEAALSPRRLLSLMAEIDYLVENNSQFIIATHSPILMAYPNADILEFTCNGLNFTDYKSTEHYTLTRRILENPEKFLRDFLNK